MLTTRRPLRSQTLVDAMWRKPPLFVILIFITGLCYKGVDSSLSLYLPSTEVHTLFGLKAEVYYVRDGQVNHYALGFVVLVPPQLSQLNFRWRNSRSTPMPYLITIQISDTKAMAPPQLNISRQGIVPNHEEGFTIALPCTGKVSAEVDIHIEINVTMPPANITSLSLKRKKVCLEDGSSGTVMSATAASSTNTIYLAVGCACVLVTFVTLIVIFFYVRSRKSRRNEIMSSYDRSSPMISTQAQTFLRVDTPNNMSVTGSYSSFRRLTPISINTSSVQQINDFKNSVELDEQINKISLERRKVILQEKLQEGTFGQIYRGLLIEDENEINSQREVFVKTVSDHASERQVSLLLQEGMMMFGVIHPNVLPIIAVCTDTLKQPLLIYPYMDQGNLKRFLQKCKFSAEGHCLTLLTQDLVAMAIQIIQGILFLHKLKIIHKDIATRNCVVDSHLHIKITDNALSRDLFPNDYHCLGDNENRPVRWLALESLLHREFTTASDVWSFGVLLWELMTLGQQPYIEVDPFEMDANLRDGYRLAQPINCPDSLFHVMALCWEAYPQDRPTFQKLLIGMQSFYTALGSFI